MIAVGTIAGREIGTVLGSLWDASQMDKPKYAGSFSVDLPMDKIQVIRLAHALMESGYQVHIPKQHSDKFMHLKDLFSLEYVVGDEGITKLPCLKISHRDPLTEVGSVQRPLVFPRAVFEYCRRLWAEERSIRFSFAGLVTKKRSVALKTWIKNSFPGLKVMLPKPKNRFLRLKDKLLKAVYQQQPSMIHEFKSGDVVFWSSERGREFPIKAWDEQYYEMLANSQFVLCPDGAFTWTYRFFEAAMCGAIPVIENYCSLYKGFRFFSMSDPISKLSWSRETADYNFKLCMERLTIPSDVLNREIALLLKSSADEE